MIQSVGLDLAPPRNAKGSTQDPGNPGQLFAELLRKYGLGPSETETLDTTGQAGDQPPTEITAVECECGDDVAWAASAGEPAREEPTDEEVLEGAALERPVIAVPTPAPATVPADGLDNENAASAKSGSDPADTAMALAGKWQGLDTAKANFAHPSVDAPDSPGGSAPHEDGRQDTGPASPAAELAQELEAAASGAAVAAAAQAIGDQARAAAPGQTKSPGENAATGRGVARSAERPAPPPAPTKNREPRPSADAIAALAAGAAQPAQDQESDQAETPRRLVIEAQATSAFAPAAREAAATSGFAAKLLQPHPPAVQQLTIHIQRAVRDGLDRISLRLTPPELGRIDVKLEFANDGRLSASIAVERPETLDLLQRDARGLERALQDAGIKTESGSLTFNLRGDGRQDAREDGAPARMTVAVPADKAEDGVTIVEIVSPRPSAAGTGAIDIRV